MIKIEKLEALFGELKKGFLDLNLHSRVHSLKGRKGEASDRGRRRERVKRNDELVSEGGRGRVFVKRDDELGGGKGSKVRKYCSLLPFLSSNYEKVILSGSIHSNNVFSLAQFLKETDLEVVPLFYSPNESLKRKGGEELGGNCLFSLMLLGEEYKMIRWLEKGEEHKMRQVGEEMGKKEGAFFIPEGADVEASFDGSLTLPLDIFRNELELQLESEEKDERERCSLNPSSVHRNKFSKEPFQHFQHIFVDSGTGLTACCVVEGLKYLERKGIRKTETPTTVHIFQVAPSNGNIEFSDMMREKRKRIEEHISKNWNFSFINVQKEEKEKVQVQLHNLSNAASFGSVNSKVINFVVDFASKEGILLDTVSFGSLPYFSPHFLALKGLQCQTLF